MTIPTGDVLTADNVCKSYAMKKEDEDMLTRLIILKVRYFDVILGRYRLTTKHTCTKSLKGSNQLSSAGS